VLTSVEDGGGVAFMIIDPSALPQVSGLRRSIGDISRLRYNLAHEVAHVLLFGPNSTGMTAALDTVRYFDDTSLGPPFRVHGLTQAIAVSRGIFSSRGIHSGLSIRLRIRIPADVLPDSKAALLRFLGRVLTALSLVLVLVLAALSRHPDAITFVLVMLAVCLRYGRRGDSDGYAFLPFCPHQRSLGSRPPS
jgi:hypothetical protein